MADQAGKIVIPKDSAEVRDRILRDLRLGAIDAGLATEPPTGPGSEWFMLAASVANVSQIGLANISLAERAHSVFDAEGPELDQIRKDEGLPVVEPTGGTGKVRITVSGSAVIPAGTQLTYTSGLRARTTLTVTNPANGAEIDVEAIDTGSATNAVAGTKLTFVAPPVNVSAETTVSTAFPLSGGTDTENDERKRTRILNKRQRIPGGGNWAQIRQLVLDQAGGVQDVYVYCAPGGPSTQVAVPVRAFDASLNDFSRVTNDALLTRVRGLIQSEFSPAVTTVVRAAADEEADFALQVTIPDSALSGGNGLGWVDQAPWPQLVGGDGGRVTLTSIDSDNDSLTINASTTVEPVDGQTTIAWWSAVDKTFYAGNVISHSGSSGAWVVNLDKPIVGKFGAVPQAGDYICPAAVNLDEYAKAWVALFEELGPGALIIPGDDRLPRAERHPRVADEDPSDITTKSLGEFGKKFPEISAIAFSYSPTTTPTIPTTVNDAPNVLIPGQFAVYPT